MVKDFSTVRLQGTRVFRGAGLVLSVLLFSACSSYQKQSDEPVHQVRAAGHDKTLYCYRSLAVRECYEVPERPQDRTPILIEEPAKTSRPLQEADG